MMDFGRRLISGESGIPACSSSNVFGVTFEIAIKLRCAINLNPLNSSNNRWFTVFVLFFL